MKTLWAFIAGAGYLCADLDSRVADLEKEMKDVHVQTALGKFGALSASARPQNNGQSWYVSGEWLWWKAFEGSTDYAYNSKSNGNGAGLPPFEGKTKSTDFEWNSGFRLLAGYSFAHDEWDANIYYTRFNTHSHHTAKMPEGGAQVPLNDTNVGSGSRFDTANMHWNVHYASLDGELGRNYFVGKKIGIRPHCGLKQAWINQHFTAEYTQQTPVPIRDTSRGKNEFEGFGPTIGIDSKWFLSNHFNLFGSAAGALLYGHFDISSSRENASFGSSSKKFEADKNDIAPMAQIKLGAGWETIFNDNYNHIAVTAAYELQYWWNQNQGLFFSQNTAVLERLSDDIGFHGLMFDIRVDF